MFHIGILQLTQNLDDAVKGFQAGLASLQIEAEYTYVNADGNTAELPKLAQKLAQRRVDLIFACSTPAAQAAKALHENIPVVFTPVFDPVAVELVDSMKHPGGKVTGMSGMVAAKEKVAFIKKLLPKAKKIALLLASEDQNAQIETKHFSEAAKGFFDLAVIALACQEDISLLVDELPADLDAVFMPIGKIIEDNFASIVYYTDERGLPIIASHAPNVSAGALGALVADHVKLGEECAAKAKQILLGQNVPADIAVGITHSPQILLNAFVAENLAIELPSDLTATAKEIFN